MRELAVLTAVGRTLQAKEIASTMKALISNVPSMSQEWSRGQSADKSKREEKAG